MSTITISSTVNGGQLHSPLCCLPSHSKTLKQPYNNPKLKSLPLPLESPSSSTLLFHCHWTPFPVPTGHPSLPILDKLFSGTDSCFLAKCLAPAGTGPQGNPVKLDHHSLTPLMHSHFITHSHSRHHTHRTGPQGNPVELQGEGVGVLRNIWVWALMQVRSCAAVSYLNQIN